MKASIDQKKKEHCSVIEVDSGLSIYHTDAEFVTQIAFLNSLSEYAEQQGLKTVIYIPTLETNVPGGCNNEQPTAISMALTKPKWLQIDLEGKLNFFCGAKEVWVENGMESAWFDPNNPEYRSHFLARVNALAKNTKLSGLWGDVPIFSDTFGGWAGGGPHSKYKFVAWASEKNFGYTDLPTISDANAKTAIFNAWIQWRHETLDEWQESILLAGEAGNPDFIFAAEIYSVDYLDGYWIGLDGGFKKNSRQFRVWEIDSVSNTGAMNYATVEDFRNKIAMNKYAVAADNGQHSWLFAYGNTPLDSGLVMAAIAGIGASPFDSKTPTMTQTVGSEYRTRWYQWLEEMAPVIFDYKRRAEVGVIYSSSTRDLIDSATGCAYGMFTETDKNPTDDDDWWAALGDLSSLVLCDHLSSYRGIMNALNTFQTSHKVVIDTAHGLQSLDGLKVLFLPSVQAISEASALAIKSFVFNGGILFITGKKIPGTLNVYGNVYSNPVFKEILPLTLPANFVKGHGRGFVIYRPDITGRSLFKGGSNLSPPSSREYNDARDTILQVIRQHVRETVIVLDEEKEFTDRVYVETGASPDGDVEAIFITNLEGVKQPVTDTNTILNVKYRCPDGKEISGVNLYTPDESKWEGSLSGYTNINGGQWYNLPVIVIEQFATVVISLNQKTQVPSAFPTLNFPTNWESSITKGFNFIKNKMRDASKPKPLRYG
eukprot:Awhi_evm1s6068